MTRNEAIDIAVSSMHTHKVKIEFLPPEEVIDVIKLVANPKNKWLLDAINQAAKYD